MGAGTPLSAHAKLHDCGESDGQDRQGHCFGGGVVGGGGWVYLSCFVACILGDEAAQSTSLNCHFFDKQIKHIDVSEQLQKSCCSRVQLIISSQV